MEGAVQNAAAERTGIEHASHEGLEFNIAMVKGWGYRASELELISLKAAKDVSQSASESKSIVLTCIFP